MGGIHAMSIGATSHAAAIVVPCPTDRLVSATAPPASFLVQESVQQAGTARRTTGLADSASRGSGKWRRFRLWICRLRGRQPQQHGSERTLRTERVDTGGLVHPSARFREKRARGTSPVGSLRGNGSVLASPWARLCACRQTTRPGGHRERSDLRPYVRSPANQQTCGARARSAPVVSTSGDGRAGNLSHVKGARLVTGPGQAVSATELRRSLGFPRGFGRPGGSSGH